MEFLIRVNDRSARVDDSKRGDVIAACQDGWAWSTAEQTNPDWVIVVAPLTQAEADDLLAVDTDIATGNLKRRRKYTVNVTGLLRAPTNKISASAMRALIGLKT